MEKNPSIAYRVWLAGVTAVMVLLPIVYCATLAALACFLYVHATTHTAWLARQLPAIEYMVILLGGLALLFAMLKPLIAPSAERARPIPITTDQAPALFKLISMVCQKTGAGLPAEVELTCQTDVSASFIGGLGGMWSGGLRLSIGLPVVAGLSQRELAGIVARELGRLDQKGSMRMLWIVSRIDSWLVRVVFEKDQWDEGISEAIGISGRFAAGILRVIQECTLLGRIALVSFCAVGRVTNSRLLRQMEWQADCCGIDAAGSTAFAAMLRRILRLQAAEELLWQRLMAVYGSEPRAVDLPELIVAAADNPGEAAGADHRPCHKRRMRIWSRDLTSAQRLAGAAERPRPGLPLAEKPASGLLPDFGQLCRDATGRRYSILPPPGFRQTGR